MAKPNVFIFNTYVHCLHLLIDVSCKTGFIYIRVEWVNIYHAVPNKNQTL